MAEQQGGTEPFREGRHHPLLLLLNQPSAATSRRGTRLQPGAHPTTGLAASLSQLFAN